MSDRSTPKIGVRNAQPTKVVGMLPPPKRTEGIPANVINGAQAPNGLKTGDTLVVKVEGGPTVTAVVSSLAGDSPATTIARRLGKKHLARARKRRGFGSKRRRPNIDPGDSST